MNKKIVKNIAIVIIVATIASCKAPALIQHNEKQNIPTTFATPSTDSNSIAQISWKQFFDDKNLTNLIDSALKNNQELLMMLQEIEISKNDILSTSGKLTPIVVGRGAVGAEKVGRYTSQGAGDASAEITPGKEVPEILGDNTFSANASWEIDIWNKLHNAKKAAITRYLATAEGRNFFITNMVSEIANSYYELLALDNQLAIVKETIQLQKNALEVIKIQKQAAATTELAVKKFEAEVLNSQNKEYDILKNITIVENKINFLVGRFPQTVERSKTTISNLTPKQALVGLPSELLQNRTDIKQAELELEAAKLDVKIARAEFYPSLEISSVLGLQAFSPKYLLKAPQSILTSLAGDLTGPLINKKAIKAEYNTANSKQLQAIYNYQKTVLNAFVEVSTELSNITNYEKMYGLKNNEVAAHIKAIEIANDLFRANRADYLEVLLTQRDALDSKLELVDTKLNQFTSVTNIYRALGGGWK